MVKTDTKPFTANKLQKVIIMHIPIANKEWHQKISHRVKEERTLRRRQRKALKRQRKRKKVKHKKESPLTEYSSPVMTCLNNSSFALPFKSDESAVKFKVPKVFCMSRNPDESIQFLRKLYGAATNLLIRSIQFDYTACVHLGICALTVMNVILTECCKWRKSLKSPIEYTNKVLSGFWLSQNSEIDKLLKVSNVLNHSGMSDKPLSNQYDSIESLSLQIGGNSSDVATLVIDYINRSLYRHNLMLTARGKNHFGKLLGEIVDNCHQHGGPETIWYTLGHYSYDVKSNSGKCRLTIFDFGQTIYEGLKKGATKSMQKRINHYVRRSRVWFSSQESEETLYTLFSLQQRASRFASKKDAVRGNGTVVFLDAFQRLFATEDDQDKSLLSITSGKCSILFDGTYLLKEVTYEGKYTNKIIAFNSDNDLKKPPDHRYVRNIKNGFPGTIISMELHISNSHISKKEC